MTGKTHILIGALAGLYLATGAHTSPVETIVLIGLGGFSALLPDVDHPNSRIRNTTGFAGDVAFGWLKHRGITHSAAAALLIALLAIQISPSRSIGTVIAVGYASHLFADLITPQGVPLFAPLQWRRIAIPLIQTGSLIETGFAMLITGVSLWLIFK